MKDGCSKTGQEALEVKNLYPIRLPGSTDESEFIHFETIQTDLELHTF